VCVSRSGQGSASVLARARGNVTVTAGPLDWVRGGSRAAEEPARAEVAPAASLDGTRPIETAEVLKKA
jgi:hypothetical protein